MRSPHGIAKYITGQISNGRKWWSYSLLCHFVQEARFAMLCGKYCSLVRLDSPSSFFQALTKLL